MCIQDPKQSWAHELKPLLTIGSHKSREFHTYVKNISQASIEFLLVRKSTPRY